MEWKIFLQPEVQQFIKNHINDDVRALALKSSPDKSWPYSLILDQIKVLQKARIKSPDLYETNGIIFPSNDLYEQSSSSACAAYKASLVSGDKFVDLTAGSGLDAYHFSKNFKSGTLVERDELSAGLLDHNMHILQNSNGDECSLHVQHMDCVEYVDSMDNVDFVFVDPQRREGGRKGIFDLSSCSPDVISLLDVLKSKAAKVMVKASPVLDIEKAIGSLEFVSQVHVVQWQNECKEVLYLLDFLKPKTEITTKIIAADVNLAGKVQQKLSFYLDGERKSVPEYGLPKKYIFEPGPAFQKSGGFKSISVQLGLLKIHQHSHLYTSDELCPNFPGKTYEVVDVVPVQSKAVKLSNADLALRNFPGNVRDLKKKLKLSDGGCHRVFATTLCDGAKKLIICKK